MKELFGSKSVERILLYLLVNESSYAHELHRMMEVPLNPIQKALLRLERGGILTAMPEGKVRLYRLNDEYPLFEPLENLLKKAFSVLPAHEKKRYYRAPQVKTLRKKEQIALLERVWEQLITVSHVSLNAVCKGKWQRKGSGQVIVTAQSPTLLFHEKGSWRSQTQESYTYNNCFRWTLSEGLLGLEHLHFGPDHPVFLFHLTPKGPDRLESLHPHLCGHDTYSGWLETHPCFLRLHFKTLGPKKNETVEYIYS